MTTPVLEVSGLAKKFCRNLLRSFRYAIADIAGELVPMGNGGHLRRDEFWALEDIDFTVSPGQAVAVMGANGAGKSTLLRIVAGLLKPDRGEVVMNGRLGTIIELGAGFHPVLTGRENVALAAAQQGMPPSQARRLFEEVEDFAGIGAFIDAPVQSYSSGMKSRLAFAVAAQSRPDLLLVDEALAVGDINFQRKCVDHMRRYIQDGGSLLFVSHNMLQVQAVCERALLLKSGRVEMIGDANRAIELMLEPDPAPSSEVHPLTEPQSPVHIGSLRAEPVDGDALQTGQAARVTLECTAEHATRIRWLFTAWNQSQEICVAGISDSPITQLEPGVNRLHCLVPRWPLMAGTYRLRASAFDAESNFPLARIGDDGRLVEVSVTTASSPLANLRYYTGQLTTIEADWP